MSLVMRSMNIFRQRGCQTLRAARLPKAAGYVFHRNMETLPVVDISSLLGNGSESEKRETSLEVGRALRDLGFLYVTNHGVDQTLRDKVMEYAVRFFDMPVDKKMEVCQASDSVRGYVRFGSERTYSKADWKEAMYHMTEEDFPSTNGIVDLLRGTNPWPNPEYLPGFRENIDVYVRKLNALGQVMMSAIAVSLGVDEKFFSRQFITNPFTEFGMFHYPPYQDAHNIDIDSEWAIGPHTDYGCLTLLSQCETGGLQVKASDGGWIDAPPRKDAFVVNACDMLEAWTNGACKSNHHRVTLPKKDRYSVVAFFGPDFDSQISPLPLNNVGSGSFNKSFDFPVHYGSYVAQKYAASYRKKEYQDLIKAAKQ